MPRSPRKPASVAAEHPQGRSLWSGTITFGLVSIPVNLLSAVRPRKTALKLVDDEGHALGRKYYCAKEGKPVDYDELTRGYESGSGRTIEMTDDDLSSVAPELSAEIELGMFVPLAEIPPLHFQRPYLLAPAGKSVKAYVLLAAAMQRADRAAIGKFVMREREYLIAIISDDGVLRAQTLRHADELRTPKSIGLPSLKKPAATKVTAFSKAIAAMSERSLAMSEMRDLTAGALEQLALKKAKAGEQVIHPKDAESEDGAAEAGSAKVIDLMAALRKTLSKTTVVETADPGAPIDLAERRARKQAAAGKTSRSRTKRSSRRR